MKNINRMLACFTAAILLTGCTDSKGATRILTANGYSDIQTQGYGLGDCGDDDSFSTKFTAKTPHGDSVKGTVCSGILKGYTIRFR